MSIRVRELLTLALLAPAAQAQEDVLDATVFEQGPVLEWDARAVEHLLNRAGFGARPAEIERWVEAGPEALLADLFAVREDGEPFYVDPLVYHGKQMRSMGREALQREKVRLRRENRRQQQTFLGHWVERMLDGSDPLRERMVLFWHGFFTSAATKVRLSYPMTRQNELFREHALGNYGELLGAILRDPAMLIYLDNVTNRRDHPNENLARELMELFSLGEGNYTERDVQEVARALTGYTIDRGREFRFDPSIHDFGPKVVLGVEGRHDADAVVEILLAQPACARWVTQRLITYLEGKAPDDGRLEDYAAFLRDNDYELAPFLERLFLDPAFYREELIGARVQSPIDYLVGSCRRLGLRPHPGFVLTGATYLGQQLFEPPNVKGWEEGEAWITTATLMNRGNLMGALLGVVSIEDLDEDAVLTLEDPALAMAPEGEEGGEEGEVATTELEMLAGEGVMTDEGAVMTGSEGEAPNAELARERAARSRVSVVRKILKLMDSTGYRPRLNLTARLTRRHVATDREIVDRLCDELLAIEAPLETRRMLTAFLHKERELLGRDQGELQAGNPEFEHLLRRLAHLILSLPEAQLG